jgi:hypothetical protein
VQDRAQFIPVSQNIVLGRHDNIDGRADTAHVSTDLLRQSPAMNRTLHNDENIQVAVFGEFTARARTK